MTTINLQFDLSEAAIREASKYGLLNASAIEKLLQAELKQRRIAELLQVADRLANSPLAPLTVEEIATEIQAVRDEK
jgi:predicted XRE-type DNA-binding protein